MQIYTSYFYQVRFFPKNLVPLSTAHWDPKWYYNNKYQGYQWKDKRGVINGLRAEPFVPGAQLDGACHGPETCYEKPPRCKFQLGYLAQLRELNFDNIMVRFQTLAQAIAKNENLSDVNFALLLHEAPQNPCSERIAIQLWFMQNNHPIFEWHAS